MKKYLFPYANKEGRCHDCGVLPGEKHHDGCDVEGCPRTFKQRIACECERCRIVKLADKIPFGFEDGAVRKIAQKSK